MQTRKSASNSNLMLPLIWVFLAVLLFALAGNLFHNFPLAYFPSKPFSLGKFRLLPAVFGFFIGSIPALLAGWSQLLLLRRQLPISRWWFVSVSTGMGVMHFLSDGFDNALDLSVAVVAGGLSVGLVQAALLRPHLPFSGWWVLVSVGSWYLGWVIGFALLRAGITLTLAWVPWEGYVKQHTILGTLVGLTYGTGTMFLLLGMKHKGGK